MSTTDQLPPLPEPEGVIVVGTQALRGFTADQMHAYALQAQQLLATHVQGELPEPELGYIKTDKSNQPAFSARQMREAMKPSTTEPVGEIKWAANVPNSIREAVFYDLMPPIGTKLYTSPQPAQRPAAVPMTEERIRSMCKQGWVFETVKQWVRIIEAHHGITAQAKKETP